MNETIILASGKKVPITVGSLVDRGLELCEHIELLKTELGLIESALIEEARQGEHVDLADEDREGKQFLAKGSEFTVPVVFTADKLVASFRDCSELHRILDERFSAPLYTKFYRRQVSWEMIPKSGKAFRKLAGELLDRRVGPPFVTACLSRDKAGIPKSDTKVEWKRAEKQG